MALDHRRVQTAVLGSPDSDHPLSLPTDRVEARAYLARYRGQPFYCGRLLGGCGWQLMDKLYKDRVCHFAHYPDPNGLAPECQRRYSGADSADHLYIHRGLTRKFGQAQKRQRFNGRMKGDQCVELLVTPKRTRSAIKVQFVNLSAEQWTREDKQLRRRLGWVDWLIGPQAATTASHLLDRDGYALHVRCMPRGNTRTVEVGTETRDGDLAWVALDHCDITEKGIVTPLLQRTRNRDRSRANFRPGATATASPSPPVHLERSNQTRNSRTLTIYEEVRSKCTHLAQDIDQAKRVGDLERVQQGLREFRLALVRVSAYNPEFKQEATQLKNYEAWVESAQRTKAAARAAELQAQIDRVKKPQLAQLRQIIKLLRRAEASQDRTLGRKLAAEGRQLLKGFKGAAFRADRKALVQSTQWLEGKAEPPTSRPADATKQKCRRIMADVLQAGKAMKLSRVETSLAELRRTLSDISTSDSTFAIEMTFLSTNEVWLSEAREERRRPARTAQVDHDEERKFRAKQANRLAEVFIRLETAKRTGNTEAVLNLLFEGRSLVKILGELSIGSKQRKQLEEAATWIAGD